jgi:anti-anti-sigma regulatory factor
MQIYVSKNGQRYGPYSVEELRLEVHSAVFTPAHFASCDNGRSWTPISAVPGMGPLAYTVAIDTENNLLVIRYRDHVRASAVERCAEEVGAALAGLPSGFQLLVDFTELESMEVSCAPHLEHIMELCNERGVSVVVRIIPDPKRDIGLGIMSYFHYGPDVRIRTCESLEEAAAILAMQNDDGQGRTLP